MGMKKHLEKLGLLSLDVHKQRISCGSSTKCYQCPL